MSGKAVQKFPKTLLVWWDGGDEPYLATSETVEGAAPEVGEERRVARYVLDGQVTLETVAREVKATDGR